MQIPQEDPEMAGVQVKRFDEPDDSWTFGDAGRSDIIELAGMATDRLGQGVQPLLARVNALGLEGGRDLAAVPHGRGRGRHQLLAGRDRRGRQCLRGDLRTGLPGHLALARPHPVGIGEILIEHPMAKLRYDVTRHSASPA